jgi:predicted phosphodiesterase
MRLFAVEPTAVQLDWRSLSPGHHVVTVGARAVAVDGDGGPGAVVVDGLEPDTPHPVALDGRTIATATTLAVPPGPELTRIATVSDLHVGETRFGRFPRIDSGCDAAHAHPIFCTRAAVDELVAWGAELLVVKGDIAHYNRAREYELAATLFADLPIPVMVLPGNHDGGNHRGHDPARTLARHGLHLVEDVTSVDLPGVRVVGVDSRTPTQRGTVDGALPDVVSAVATAPAALVVLHHQLMTTPVATYPPPGVPSGEANRFLDAIAVENPSTVVTSGHTHRHRARRHGPLLVTEVGSTKDYPGTWGGYVVYEGGMVQTARRVMAPEAIRWTERTAAMFGGAWGRWSPGRLADRSVSHSWVRDRTPDPA